AADRRAAGARAAARLRRADLPAAGRRLRRAAGSGASGSPADPARHGADLGAPGAGAGRRALSAGAAGRLVPVRRPAARLIAAMSADNRNLAQFARGFAAFPGQRPWPAYRLDLADWLALLAGLAEASSWSLLGLWGEPEQVWLALRDEED